MQRTTINGKSSEWKNIQADVPQGSALGPLLFFVYINDLIDGMKSIDTSLFVIVDDPQSSFEILSHDLKVAEAWENKWQRSFNPDPIKPTI